MECVKDLCDTTMNLYTHLAGQEQNPACQFSADTDERGRGSSSSNSDAIR
jgi:hypothetical protein